MRTPRAISRSEISGGGGRNKARYQPPARLCGCPTGGFRGSDNSFHDLRFSSKSEKSSIYYYILYIIYFSIAARTSTSEARTNFPGVGHVSPGCGPSRFRTKHETVRASDRRKILSPPLGLPCPGGGLALKIVLNWRHLFRFSFRLRCVRSPDWRLKKIIKVTLYEFQIAL